MTTLASGEKKLRELVGALSGSSNMNEAQTRFHIIDKVLFECLGWDRDSNVEVEKSEHGQFTDYELGKPRLAILEAKREGNAFSFPASTTNGLMSDLKSLMRMNGDIKEAIEQAQDYCGKRGVPIAIVSNGHQYIMFLASRQDGVSVFEGRAVVFRSLQHMLDNFEKAWQLMSSAGIKERNIFSYLSSGNSGIPSKLSSKLAVFPSVRYTSEMQASLRQLSELFLQDVVENNEVEESFFKECYCESGAISSYALLSKNILETRYASLFSEGERAPHLQSVKERKNRDNFTPDILAESIARRPIVLLGDVGVGKTSFVKNLIYNSAYEAFQRAVYIYIDLGSKAALTEDIRSFVLKEIERQLFAKYNIDVNDYHFIKGVYSSEIHRFSNGIWGKKKESEPALYETKLIEMLERHNQDVDEHLRRSIESYSKSSKRQIIIFLDNADQRDFEVQQATFIISQELAKNWSATVFVSVRPQTFFKSKRSGALTAYPNKIFTISPPRIDMVIEKRLQFALQMSEGKIPVETLNYLTVNSSSLTLFIKALLTSLSENSDLYLFLANITGGNIRAAIEFVTGFIGSPNVDAVKIIDLMKAGEKYIIPLHEFTKSALLGDYSHYNPETSLAMNVFDVASADCSEHFLVPILLAYLDSSGSHKDQDGFCVSSMIFEELQNIGFTSVQIEAALRRTSNKKLIETAQRVTFEEDGNGMLIGEMPSSFRLTTIGAYHLRRWIGVFTYLDAMVFDTPIFEKQARENISVDLNSLSINSRFNRAVEFRAYLLKAWQDFRSKPMYFNFEEFINEGESTFTSVKKAIGRKN